MLNPLSAFAFFNNDDPNPDDHDDFPQSVDDEEKPSPMPGTVSGSPTPYPGTIDHPERAGEREKPKTGNDKGK
jgi:hypothetical protein